MKLSRIPSEVHRRYGCECLRSIMPFSSYNSQAAPPYRRLKSRRMQLNHIASPLSAHRPCSSSSSVSSFRSTFTCSNNSDQFECSDDVTRKAAERDFIVLPDFVSKDEEASLLKEVERFLKKTRYEYDHWDNAIHGFRETEKSSWSEGNGVIIQRMRDAAFPACSSQLSPVHVLDLAPNGFIKPHVDSVKFCGSTIAGLSLISAAIMRLVHTEDKTQWVNALIKPRSLYIMRDTMRYDYTHEVLRQEEAVFRGEPVARGRRVSIICRSGVS